MPDSMIGHLCAAPRQYVLQVAIGFLGHPFVQMQGASKAATASVRQYVRTPQLGKWMPQKKLKKGCLGQGQPFLEKEKKMKKLTVASGDI